MLVMSKDEIAERQVKAKNVKNTGITSRRLPPTSYELKVKSYKKDMQKDLTEVIELSENALKFNNVSPRDYLLEDQNIDDNEECQDLLLLAAKDLDILVDFICSEDL